MVHRALLRIVCLAMLCVTGVAHAATWQVLGGSVYVDPDPVAGSPAFSSLLTPGSPGVLIEGSYQDQNIGEIFSTVQLGSSDPNFFWNYPMNFFTAPYGNVDPALKPAPSINLATNTADLSSFVISWYEVAFESTGATNVPITRNQDGSYHFSWQLTGGFSSTGTATMTMDLAPVPVPAAVWLFGSGLIGLLGIGRRFRPQL